GDPDHDGRPTAGPVRDGSTAIGRLRARRRGRVVPATAEATARQAGQFGPAELTCGTVVGHHHHTARDRNNPVPYSWQSGGPITLAGDMVRNLRRLSKPACLIRARLVRDLASRAWFRRTAPAGPVAPVPRRGSGR